MRVLGASGLFFQRVTQADLPHTQDSWTPTLHYWHKELVCIFPFKSHLKQSPSGSLRAARGEEAALGSVLHREARGGGVARTCAWWWAGAGPL